MVPRKRPGLEEYLSAVHAAPGFGGVQEFHRRFAQHLGHERTLARWRRSLRSRLRVFPSFTIEGLGLTHLHLVVLSPDERWLCFPYAVEHAWITRDFLHESLYLHCLVPAEHVGQVEGLIRRLARSGCGHGCVILRSESGWQHLHHCGHQPAVTTGAAVAERSILRDHPLVVPVAVTAWNTDTSLPGLWAEIRSHLGAHVRDYLPRQRVHQMNGKEHVKDACRSLAAAGLFRQQVIRYVNDAGDGIEVLLLDRTVNDRMVELLEELRTLAQWRETYEGHDGAVVERVQGSPQVLGAITRTMGTLGTRARVFLVDHHEHPGRVRFCYEFLFNPKTGSWVFPLSTILEHMRCKP